MNFRSGFVSIIGRPNVGKSTILNGFAGEKIAITSNKPQTTRNVIKAIDTGEDYQIVFMDTPGIHKPRTRLGDFMVNSALEALEGVDLVLFLVEATDQKLGPGDQYIIEQIKGINIPVFCLINKIDLVEKKRILPLISIFKELMDFSQIIPISALEHESLVLVKNEIKNTLPKGPKYFPEDMITDQPERVIAAEIIREKILELVSEEVPHGVGVEVLSFKNREEKEILDIQANIYCDKKTHKGILIGKDGKMLKRVGSLSRIEIERIFNTKVFLELWVKIKSDWRNSNTVLKTLGYKR
ncbi:MAG: GTPase Era [Clostridium sp.]|nr:GTPase Era [Clostridium sp.]